jgi:hypothetical protein
VIVSGIHAREWYAQEVCLLLVTHLLAECQTLCYSQHSHKAGWLANANLEIVIVPVSNLFGHLYTLAGPHKAVTILTPEAEISKRIAELEAAHGHSRTHIPTGSGACRGNRKVGPWLADINRNFPVESWGDTRGASRLPLDDDYCGPRPASELETQAIMTLIKTLKPDLTLDVHSFGNDVLEPGGMDPKALDANKRSVRLSRWLSKIAPKMLLNLKDSYVPRHLYPCSGSFEDWIYFKTDSAMLTLELGVDSFSSDDLRGQKNKLALPKRLMSLFEIFCNHKPE